MRWWSELAAAGVLDRLYLSHHPEQASSVDHTIAVNDLMQATRTFVTVFVTAPVALFDHAVRDYQQILIRGRAIVSLKPITESGSVQSYTQDQQARIAASMYLPGPLYTAIAPRKRVEQRLLPPYSSMMTMTMSNGTTSTQEVQQFLLQGLNQFQGWQCDIGRDLLVIEVDQVYRSVCGQGGQHGRVQDGQFTWAENSVICGKQACLCGLDLQEPKRLCNY